MFPLKIDESTELRVLEIQDAETVFALIQGNRAYLDSWLRWSGRIQTLEDTQNLIQRFAQKFKDGDGFHAGIWHENQLAGGLVCHYINRESYKSEIGYWLGEKFTGKGLATRASACVIDMLFTEEKMHRIEIQSAVDNVRSRAIADRLGFKLEGIKRDSEWLTNRFADHALYSILAHEWKR